MPKRLCSITMTPDEETIIAADKFGDVYSLPLHASIDHEVSVETKNPAQTFQPSATEFTVHTKGNLEALKQQREQKKVNPRKEGPSFEHKLLLGHVSLLTDVEIASVRQDSKQRLFLLTSDRDEHVRISRYPQAHIIHAYCMGFSDFVSKVCIVPGAPSYMVAGSGEPSLKVFDWQHGQLVSQVMLRDLLDDQIKDLLYKFEPDRSPEKLAVSGIWPFGPETSVVTEQGNGVEGFLVAMEGVPLLLNFHVDGSGQLQHRQTITLDGNVLDVSLISHSPTVTALVSLDNVHNPGSMVREKEGGTDRRMITAIEFDRNDLLWHAQRGTFEIKSQDIEEQGDFPAAHLAQAAGSSRARGEYSSLGDFLYGLENLRKKRGVQAEDDIDVVEPAIGGKEDIEGLAQQG
jgi:tRNA (guanine-N(7)-)-methyltransferase subunit TRM82